MTLAELGLWLGLLAVGLIIGAAAGYYAAAADLAAEKADAFDAGVAAALAQVGMAHGVVVRVRNPHRRALAPPPPVVRIPNPPEDAS